MSPAPYDLPRGLLLFAGLMAALFAGCYCVHLAACCWVAGGY